QRGGMIGNIYSMGLALQALEASGKFYAPREWDCEQAFAVVYGHDYQQPMAIAQLLPALVDKPYLQAASLNCDGSTGMPPKPQLDLSSKPQLDLVHYFIINNLQGKPFKFNITVEVPDGSTLLQVLQAAEELEPVTFSFKTEQSSWGPMVVSIHGLDANTDDKTYWKFLSGEDALQEGVGTYKPHNEEVIMAVFSKY
ncbi:IF factor, partial [Galbula dea]|nr:IF factor [Galbula dea]